MTAYAMMSIEITDPERFKPYPARFPALMAPYEGKYLICDGNVERREEA